MPMRVPGLRHLITHCQASLPYHLLPTGGPCPLHRCQHLLDFRPGQDLTPAIHLKDCARHHPVFPPPVLTLLFPLHLRAPSAGGRGNAPDLIPAGPREGGP